MAAFVLIDCSMFVCVSVCVFPKSVPPPAAECVMYMVYPG